MGIVMIRVVFSLAIQIQVVKIFLYWINKANTSLDYASKTQGIVRD